MKMMIKICHISTVHSLYDTRIFLKECKTLAKSGYKVYYIVTHFCDEKIDGVNVISLPEIKGRLNRMIKKTMLAYKKALEINAEIYHIHDPELIPIALKLKKLGKKVIYDVHEDVPRDILSKEYIPKKLRPIISNVFEIFEKFASKKFDYIIAATPYIRDRFLKLGCKTIDIQNMPLLSEFTNIVHDWGSKENAVCYVGGINRIRGIYEMIEAIKILSGVKLYLAGSVEMKEEKEIIDNFYNVVFLGHLTRNEMRKLFSKVKAGLVLFHPEENHINSQPNKLFEYMSAGIPVIASNFPLWRDIVEGNNCGICVNPLNPVEISEAIRYLLENPKEAKKMGENGRKAVLEKYNWEKESEKLLYVYEKVLHS